MSERRRDCTTCLFCSHIWTTSDGSEMAACDNARLANVVPIEPGCLEYAEDSHA